MQDKTGLHVQAISSDLMHSLLLEAACWQALYCLGHTLLWINRA